jgi:hypothetical protein
VVRYELHPADVDHQQFGFLPSPSQQFFQLCRARFDRFFADRRFRYPNCFCHPWQYIPVLARGNSSQQRCKHPGTHRRILLQRLVGWNSYLAAATLCSAPQTGLPYTQLPIGKAHPAGLTPVPANLTAAASRCPWPSDLFGAQL